MAVQLRQARTGKRSAGTNSAELSYLNHFLESIEVVNQ